MAYIHLCSCSFSPIEWRYPISKQLSLLVFLIYITSLLLLIGVDERRYGTVGKPGPFADRLGVKINSANYLLAIPVDVEKPGS